jgi:hypothetical protein
MDGPSAGAGDVDVGVCGLEIGLGGPDPDTRGLDAQVGGVRADGGGVGAVVIGGETGIGGSAAVVFRRCSDVSTTNTRSCGTTPDAAAFDAEVGRSGADIFASNADMRGGAPHLAALIVARSASTRACSGVEQAWLEPTRAWNGPRRASSQAMRTRGEP